jgi:hypothetical protein
MPHWMTVLLVCLATHRLTRFVTRDAFPLVAIPREWVDTHWGVEEKDVAEMRRVKLETPEVGKFIKIPNLSQRSFAYLITCDWCTSVWVSAVLTTFAMIFIGFTWPWWILLWLTASTATGLIAQREPD